MKIVNAEFRAYDSFNDSIADHNKLLSYMRYKPVRECTDYKTACLRIYECGYATDPRYTEKLIGIIEKYRLYEYDGVLKVKESSVELVDNKIRKFQQLCNLLDIRDIDGRPLVEDNILGERTRRCIEKMPVLMVGSRGAAVEFVQEVINAQLVDGNFGPVTQQCVMKYQKEKNITVDGIVGKQTWRAIITA